MSTEHKIRLKAETEGRLTNLRIIGCSCGWQVPAGTADPDDAIALHIATRGVLDAPRPPTPGLYRHYKGGIYTVLGLAKIEATLTPAVVYTSVVDGAWWVRPIDDFNAMVTHEGVEQPRFRRLG